MVLSICGHAVGHDKTPGCLGNVPEPFRAVGGLILCIFGLRPPKIVRRKFSTEDA